jgi:hypothetical protein
MQEPFSVELLLHALMCCWLNPVNLKLAIAKNQQQK